MKLFSAAITITASFVLLFYSCSPRPFATSNKIYKQKAREYAGTLREIPRNNALDSLQPINSWIGTTNFGMRKPNLVIIHHTAQNSCEQTLATFTKDSSQVSAHYLICKDGTLHHLLNDYLRGWHAGIGKWGTVTDINSSSLGIELDNNGNDSFPELQLHTLERLLDVLKRKYNIPAANFIGHADITPGRKVDPNVHFPWKRFAENGYGMWFDDTTNLSVPDSFNTTMALRVIGYDVTNPATTIQAFRQHFLQSTVTGKFTDAEKKVLYAVMLKYL